MTKLTSPIYSSRISKKQQLSFGGYDHRKGAYDGSLWEEENMGTDYYPLLSPRKRRRLVRTLAAPRGLFGGNALAWIDGTKFYYDGAEAGELTASETFRSIVQVGPYITIWPDKKCYNTVDGSFYDLAISYTSAAGAAVFCGGTIYGEAAEANTLKVTGVDWAALGFAPGDAVTISGCTTHENNNKTPIIREVDGDELRFSELVFDVGNGSYLSRANEIIFTTDAITTQGDAFPFSAGETVKIAGCSKVGNNKTKAIVAVSQDGKTLTFAADSFTATEEAGKISIVGTAASYTEAGAVTIAREVPDLTHVFECNGRLWGVEGRTVRCCNMGIPTVWNDFEGLATGSWAADDYSAGEFTGGAAYLGYPVFFKENRLLEIYGTKPSNFQFNPSVTRGVAIGGEKSLAIAGETLFYLGREGITAYGGGTPVSVAAPFGDIRYQEAVGGSTARKYYVSLFDGTDWALFAWDTEHDLWAKEDATHALAFAWCQDLFMLDSEGRLWAIDPLHATGALESFSWAVETGEYKEQTANEKGMIKLQLRLELEGGAECALSVSYDGGEWEHVQRITAQKHGTYHLAVVPRRCDRYALRLEGTGMAWLYELTRETYTGSERK